MAFNLLLGSAGLLHPDPTLAWWGWVAALFSLWVLFPAGELKVFLRFLDVWVLLLPLLCSDGANGLPGCLRAL